MVIPSCTDHWGAGGPPWLHDCLQALADQVEAPDFEIVVVANGLPGLADSLGRASPRSTRRLGARLRIVELPTNRGFAGGVNAGLEVARGAAALVLNDDTRPAPHCLARLWSVARGEPGVGLVGAVADRVRPPQQVALHGIDPTTADGLERVEAMLRTDEPEVVDVDRLTGLCLLIPRTVIASVGGFDERYGLGNWEDDDLSLRVQLRGLRLVVARHAFVQHLAHRSFESLGCSLRDELERGRRTFEAQWGADPAGRAWLALGDGRIDDARRDATAARDAWPDWCTPDLLLGRQAAEEGRPADAIEALRRYVRARPRDLQARELLVRARAAAGDHLGAARGVAFTRRLLARR